jgi:hypothetical protein
VDWARIGGKRARASAEGAKNHARNHDARSLALARKLGAIRAIRRKRTVAAGITLELTSVR